MKRNSPRSKKELALLGLLLLIYIPGSWMFVGTGKALVHTQPEGGLAFVGIGMLGIWLATTFVVLKVIRRLTFQPAMGS
mgnify:CR=1 FL=1